MRKKLKAFSMVEMLITLAIMAIVMLIATQTLTTVFKVSTMTKLKTVTRNEIGFAVELTERLLANSNVVDVKIYDVSNTTTDPIDDDYENDVRYYNEDTGGIYTELASGEIEAIYTDDLSTADVGNEIHIRPYGYSLWVCLGYFHGYSDGEVNSNGYFLKRTVTSFPDGYGHESCFDTSAEGPSLVESPILVLNSDDVNVNDFRVSYIKSSDINNVFYIDLVMEPTHWVPGDQSNIEKAIYRQAIITTQGLTWY
jgi:prepilin-type N-terminal cleavage/methylation domain-containing protein